MLGIVQVDIQCDGQRHHNQDNQQVIIADGRQLAVFQLAQGRRSARHPDHQEIAHQECCHIVHHQGKQGLIRSPLRPEQRRNHTPYRTGQQCRNKHQDQQQPLRDLTAQVEVHRDRAQYADQRLSFSADVPEAHPESRSQRQGNTKQDCDIFQEFP